MIHSGLPILRKVRRQPEHEEQVKLFAWARNLAILAVHPELALMSCSLNGVKLSKAQAGKAKAAGLLKGEWDIRLPVARGQYHGLIIEMKAGRNKLTHEQQDYGRAMAREGWARAVCYSADEARKDITWYLGLGPFVWSGADSAPSVRD